MDDTGEDVPILDEEEVANAHGKTWTQILLDNPRLERWVVFTTARIRKERTKQEPASEPTPAV
jgi:hypothetical protein